MSFLTGYRDEALVRFLEEFEEQLQKFLDRYLPKFAKLLKKLEVFDQSLEKILEMSLNEFLGNSLGILLEEFLKKSPEKVSSVTHGFISGEIRSAIPLKPTKY